MKKWKNKIILAVLLLAIACLPVAAFLFFLTDIGPIWPGKNDINAAKNALEKAQSGLASRIKEVSLIRSERIDFIKNSTRLWMEPKDGAVDTEAMKKIEGMAKNSGVNIKSLGNTRKTKVNEQMSFFEVNVDAQAPMEDIARFLVELYKVSPKFYWTRILLRPYKPNDSKEILLSGSLRIICVDDQKLAERLSGGGGAAR
jgi:hypothetical protein